MQNCLSEKSLLRTKEQCPAKNINQHSWLLFLKNVFKMHSWIISFLGKAGRGLLVPWQWHPARPAKGGQQGSYDASYLSHSHGWLNSASSWRSQENNLQRASWVLLPFILLLCLIVSLQECAGRRKTSRSQPANLHMKSRKTLRMGK